MEDVTPFEVQKITLSGRDELANPLTASVYTLEGVEDEFGNLRLMSIGQLCMAICLQRASRVEMELVDMMNLMAENSVQLSVLSEVEQKIAEAYEKWDSTTSGTTVFEYQDTTGEKIAAKFHKLMEDAGKTDNYQYVEASQTIKVSSDKVDAFFSDVESVMDSLNTTSQELLIDIESYTAKRDDTYSLVSNLTKAFTTTLNAIQNNL